MREQPRAEKNEQVPEASNECAAKQKLDDKKRAATLEADDDDDRHICRGTD